MATAVLTDMKTRLSTAGAAVTSAKDSYDAKREQRDRLICEAVDGGMSQRGAAAAAGVSIARVSAILLASYGD
ncbi:hypothetical protein [Occultella kanbiaonis]|uniref:hypothetical protein n=1 Tax=Occultella kanbiaonis TaxID=2675754 RepID=UPI0012B894B9|nr:hypothetical protein [Occultella kanbiaonis]